MPSKIEFDLDEVEDMAQGIEFQQINTIMFRDIPLVEYLLNKVRVYQEQASLADLSMNHRKRAAGGGTKP